MQTLPPDESRGSLLLGITAFVFVLSTITLALRIYVRFKKNAFGWDDYTIFVAWVY